MGHGWSQPECPSLNRDNKEEKLEKIRPSMDHLTVHLLDTQTHAFKIILTLAKACFKRVNFPEV